MTDGTVVVAPIAPPLKPAWQTSEGWLNLATGIMGALITAHFVADGSQVATIAGAVLMAIATITHTASRTSLKKGAS